MGSLYDLRRQTQTPTVQRKDASMAPASPRSLRRNCTRPKNRRIPHIKTAKMILLGANVGNAIFLISVFTRMAFTGGATHQALLFEPNTALLYGELIAMCVLAAANIAWVIQEIRR